MSKVKYTLVAELGFRPTLFLLRPHVSPPSPTLPASPGKELVVHSEFISRMFQYIISYMGNVQLSKSLRSNCQIDTEQCTGRTIKEATSQGVLIFRESPFSQHTGPAGLLLLERAPQFLCGLAYKATGSVWHSHAHYHLPHYLLCTTNPALASFQVPRGVTTSCFLMYAFHFPLLLPPLS